MDGLSNSGRFEPNWTVIRLKVDGHSTKSGRSFLINQSIKVDARKCKTGRSDSIKLNGLKVLKLAVQEYLRNIPEEYFRNVHFESFGPFTLNQDRSH